ncbi:MAG: hypothetical protein D6806_15530 [Deltaproteobacteria bacterium]|nr:MAG: hypothetical protein D6806_15530 [Deltaproteobacteria bacterium]
MMVDGSSGIGCATGCSANAELSQGLSGFLAKAGGDPLSSVMMVVAGDDTLGGKTDRILQDVQKRRMNEAHQKRLEMMQKYWNAIRKMKRWGSLGKFFAGLLGALSAGLAVFTGGGLAPALVGAAAGLAKATGSIGSAAYNMRAADARAGRMIADHERKQAAQAREQIIQDLGSAAEQERAMLEALGRMVSQSSSVRFG